MNTNLANLTLLQLRGQYITALGEAIRAKKEESRLTWRQIADRLKIGQQSVYVWTNGQAVPSVKNLAALDELFAEEVGNRKIIEQEKKGQHYF